MIPEQKKSSRFTEKAGAIFVFIYLSLSYSAVLTDATETAVYATEIRASAIFMTMKAGISGATKR